MKDEKLLNEIENEQEKSEIINNEEIAKTHTFKVNIPEEETMEAPEETAVQVPEEFAEVPEETATVQEETAPVEALQAVPGKTAEETKAKAVKKAP